MASIEMVWVPFDGAGPHGQFHAVEAHNWLLATALCCGVASYTYSMTVTGSDMVVTIPALVAVVPDGSGSYVLINKTSSTNVTIATADATNPRVDIITCNYEGTIASSAGTPTAETGSVVEAPAPTLSVGNNASGIVLAKVKVGANVTVIGTDKVFGRAIHADIFGMRYLAGWVADNATNPTLGAMGSSNLPAGVFADVPYVHVQEAFNAGGTDQVSVGYDADTDAFGLVTDVSSTGLKNMTSGAATGYNGTARAVEAYYTSTGAAPTTGKALVVLPFFFVPPIVS